MQLWILHVSLIPCFIFGAFIHKYVRITNVTWEKRMKLFSFARKKNNPSLCFWFLFLNAKCMYLNTYNLVFPVCPWWTKIVCLVLPSLFVKCLTLGRSSWNSYFSFYLSTKSREKFIKTCILAICKKSKLVPRLQNHQSAQTEARYTFLMLS